MIHRPLSCGGNPGASRTPKCASKACAGSGDAAAPRGFRGSCLGQCGPWESAFPAVPNSYPIYVEERLRAVKVVYGLFYKALKASHRSQKFAKVRVIPLSRRKQGFE